MTDERIPHREMQKLCPDLTAKTELVLVFNPVTEDEAMYQRDGKEWVRLDDGLARQECAVPDDSGTAPLSGVDASEGANQGDDARSRDEAPQTVPVVSPDNQMTT